MEKETIYYKVAGLSFELITPKGILSSELLPNFSAFVVQQELNTPLVSRIEVVLDEIEISLDGAKLLSDVSLLWADRFQFYELGEQYLTRVGAGQIDSVYHMLTTVDFASVRIFMPKSMDADEFNMMLSWFLMIAFAQVSVFHQRILIHASVVEKDGGAYAFLGQSGTGKSTHSSLWIRYLSGFRLLNDDNPVIQVKNDGSVSVFGTPWSGKTACYRNEERPLKGFVRLRQFESNDFYFKNNRDAFITVLPSCSGIRWNKRIFSSMVDVLTKIVKSVPIGELLCLPNREAVMLSYSKINNQKII